jgi:leucyl/phenylalanyl-tRNA--protein transferase
MPIFRLTEALVFPPPHLAEDGLLAVGGDLSEERLLLAYRMGIFPWYSEGEPILWWSPDPRLILLPNEFHVSRRLDRIIRCGAFTVTMDEAFEPVMRACADAPRPGQRGTWITRTMIRAYRGLHASGYAHSVASWREGTLVGGLYGVSLGRCFFGESMFAHVSDASKVALAALVDQLRAWGFLLIDCQVRTRHLVSLGAREVTRRRFLNLLEKALAAPTRKGKWSLDLRNDAGC